VTTNCTINLLSRHPQSTDNIIDFECGGGGKFRSILTLERNVTPTETSGNMRKLQMGRKSIDPALRNCSFH
jgi:hypothetical protein